MSKRTWILLLATYVIALAVNAPASMLSSLIAQASNGRMGLANARGTLWHGEANPVLHQHNGALIALSTLHWDISPGILLSGKLGVRLQWDDEAQTQPMEAIVSPGQVELSHAYLPLPAILLDEASDFLKPAALRGQIILKSESLRLTRQGIQGIATADWLNASSLLSSIAPLGNYHLTFSGSSAGIDITLNTASGALLLAGQGHLSPTAGLAFNGTAQAASGKEEPLRELLSHLGPQEHPGISTFTLVPTPAR